MKLTKTQLKWIIKEELFALKEIQLQTPIKDAAYAAIEANSPMDAGTVHKLLYYAIHEMKVGGSVEDAYGTITQHLSKTPAPKPASDPDSRYEGVPYDDPYEREEREARRGPDKT